MSIGLGIIGCGSHARHHAAHLPKDFKIIHITDIKEEALSTIASRRKSTELTELLNDKEVEAVLIASPDKEHVEHTHTALDHGKHVLCEKPLIAEEDTFVDLLENVRLAEQKGLVLTTCHPRRFEPPCIWLKEHLPQLREQVGAPIWFEYDFSYQKRVGQTKLDNGTSFILHHVGHEIDLMNYFFGLSDITARQVRDRFDHYEVEGCRDDGIGFHLLGTQYLVRHTPEHFRRNELCRVRFERGEVKINFRTIGQEKEVTITSENYDSGDRDVITSIPADYDGRATRVMESFARQIRGEGGVWDMSELLINTEAGILLKKPGRRRIRVRK